MIEAHLPNAVLQFPDDTEKAVIDKAVADHLAQAKLDDAAREANSGAGGFLDSVARKMASGATFGFMDEAAALGDATIGHYFGRGSQAADVDTRYAENLPRERARDKTFQEDHPVVSAGAELAGGVATGILQPETLAMRLPAVAAPVNALAHTLPGLASPIVRTVGQGAAYGGLTGLGEGEGGTAERLGSAAKGAAFGAAVGPAAAAAAHGGGRVITRIGEAFGVGGDGARAERKIGQALGRDARWADDAVEQAIVRSDRAGDAPVGVVDLGGRGTVNLGATAANTPSLAMEAADRFVELRRGGRPDRLMASGDEAFGGGAGDDIATATAERQAQRERDAEPLYREAFAQPVGMTENMQAILDHPVAQQGLRKGLEIQGIENATRRARGEAEVPTHDPAIRYNDAGDPEIVGVPNMRTMDAVKRGFDAILEDARDPTTGRIVMTERLRAINDMRRQWITMLDEGHPAMGAARAAWAGPSAQLEATNAGRTAFRTDRDIVAQRMQGAAPDVADAYRLGAGRDFADRVSDPAKASGTARQLLEDRQMQQRLESLIPDPAQRQAFINSLRQETDMTAVERAVSPRAGSQTARLLAGGEDLSRDISPWVVGLGLAGSGHVGGAAAIGVRELARRLSQGINNRTANELAERLFATDAAARRRVLENVLSRRNTDVQRTEAWRNRLAAGLRGASIAAGRYAGSL